jgi:hypothetical protein
MTIYQTGQSLHIAAFFFGGEQKLYLSALLLLFSRNTYVFLFLSELLIYQQDKMKPRCCQYFHDFNISCKNNSLKMRCTNLDTVEPIEIGVLPALSFCQSFLRDTTIYL